MEKRRRILQGALLTGAAAMIAYGLISGEGLIVLHKAVRICRPGHGAVLSQVCRSESLFRTMQVSFRDQTR